MPRSCSQMLPSAKNSRNCTLDHAILSNHTRVDNIVQIMLLRPSFVRQNIYHDYKLSQGVKNFFRILVGVVLFGNIDAGHMRAVFHNSYDNEYTEQLLNDLNKNVYLMKQIRDNMVQTNVPLHHLNFFFFKTTTKKYN